MKIIAYLNPGCRHSADFRAIMKKYGLHYQEHDVAETCNVKHSRTQDFSKQHVPYVDIDGISLVNVSGEAVEEYLLEKGLVEPVDNTFEEASYADEEREGIRSKTTRFF